MGPRPTQEKESNASHNTIAVFKTCLFSARIESIYRVLISSKCRLYIEETIVCVRERAHACVWFVCCSPFCLRHSKTYKRICTRV